MSDRHTNGSSHVLNNWGVVSIGMVLSDGVGEVSSNSVTLDDGRVESWGTGDDGWCRIDERRNDSSTGDGGNSQKNGDDLIL